MFNYFKTRNDVYETLCHDPLLVKKGSLVFNAQIYKGQLLKKQNNFFFKFSPGNLLIIFY